MYVPVEDERYRSPSSIEQWSVLHRHSQSTETGRAQGSRNRGAVVRPRPYTELDKKEVAIRVHPDMCTSAFFDAPALTARLPVKP